MCGLARMWVNKEVLTEEKIVHDFGKIGRMRQNKKKKGFTRKLLLEICISFLKESWAAGTQRRRRGGERQESLALDMEQKLDPKQNPPNHQKPNTTTRSVAPKY